jgi:addiction module HigA family antidote
VFRAELSRRFPPEIQRGARRKLLALHAATELRHLAVLIMKSKLLTNITPGEILEEEFLRPMAITQYRLAKDIGVPPRRINEIVNGQRAITADTALRLGRYFRMSPEFWLNLQSHYDLEQAQERLKGSDGRERANSRQIRERRRHTRVPTLRKGYGDYFAKAS